MLWVSRKQHCRHGSWLGNVCEHGCASDSASNTLMHGDWRCTDKVACARRKPLQSMAELIGFGSVLPSDASLDAMCLWTRCKHPTIVMTHGGPGCADAHSSHMAFCYCIMASDRRTQHNIPRCPIQPPLQPSFAKTPLHLSARLSPDAGRRIYALLPSQNTYASDLRID